MAWDPFRPLRPPRPLRPLRRKLFVSYHHKDQDYRDELDRHFNHLFINKSVCAGEIDTELSTEYVDRLIRDDYISDASVVLVLIGPRTYCRKHVDWEIAAGLNPKVRGRSGLFGMLLPNHPDYVSATYWRPLIPPRLLDNVDTGYAEIYHWTLNQQQVVWMVNRAFDKKNDRFVRSVNTRLQFTRNLCG